MKLVIHRILLDGIRMKLNKRPQPFSKLHHRWNYIYENTPSDYSNRYNRFMHSFYIFFPSEPEVKKKYNARKVRYVKNNE
jgi:hypothetical protein